MSRPVKPFPVDPDVLRAIRPMQPRDLSRVVALHCAAMGQSLWAQLGTCFLMSLYRTLLANPGFIAFVYEEDGRVRGFIAGAEDPRRLFLEVLRARPLRLARSALAGLRQHPLQAPGLLWKLGQTPRYFRKAPALQGSPAESLFCSFEPDLRGKRISGHINKVLFDELLARGHEQVQISTEEDNEAALRQLRSWGFEERARFPFYGKGMILFSLNLSRSPRVEPVRRYR